MLSTPAALPDTPLPANGIAKTDGTENFLEGETLYVKYTTGATTTSTDTTITLSVNY
jgi:hypothetical protein